MRDPTFSRRGLIGAALLAAAAGRALAAGEPAGAGPRLGPPTPFSFDALKRQAAASAARAYAPPLPAPDVSALTYDAVGEVNYRPAMSRFADRPGASVRMFPLSRAEPGAVRIHQVIDGVAREVLYGADLFETHDPALARVLAAAPGFSGFRVMNADGRTDWLAFQGASYFRAADPFDQYGLSARGLAIDTTAAKPEAFPTFTDFWLEPTPEGGLTIYAAMEGRQLAGAYRFGASRGAAGLVQDIDCALFFREPVEQLGVAPLTSMFWYGENGAPAVRDWRPEIHDSDGLAIWTGVGERIWRPLIDPPRVLTNSFVDAEPRGYGLIQRDRTFDHYQDDGAFYDRRPSAWVEPVGDWGPGSVTLVEIPTAHETDDNVVAFWTPKAPVRAGDALNFRYRLHWTADAPASPGLARVVATRTGPGGRPGLPPLAGVTKLVVDFDGAVLAGLDRGSGVEPVVTIDQGQIESAVAYPIVGTGQWRLMVDVSLLGAETAVLKGFLSHDGVAISETWTYQLFVNDFRADIRQRKDDRLLSRLTHKVVN